MVSPDHLEIDLLTAAIGGMWILSEMQTGVAHRHTLWPISAIPGLALHGQPANVNTVLLLKEGLAQANQDD